MLNVRHAFATPAAIDAVAGFLARLEAGFLPLHLLDRPDKFPFRLPPNPTAEAVGPTLGMLWVHTPLHGKVIDSAGDPDARISKAGEVTMS